MAVYKEINRADGSGVTTFYRISDILDTAETDDKESQSVVIDYNQAQNKPSINGVALVGNKTSEDLGLQPAGDYITNNEADEKFIDEDELEAKNYVNQTELQDAIAHIEHFHREIVEALPVTGMDNVLYMVRKGGTGEDIYNEYIWVGLSNSENGYEFLGTTATDLTDYYKKSQVDAALATKVDKEGGKGLSEENYTLAEKTKLAGLKNYDDTEIQAEVSGLNTDINNLKKSNVTISNTLAELKPDVDSNTAAVSTIYDLLDNKMTAIRLVEQGDGWVWMNLEGSRLTYAQASAALGHENCMLFIEQLENDGKVIPAEYKSDGDHINVIFKDLDSLVHIMTCGEDDVVVTKDVTTTNGQVDFTVEDEAIGYTTKMTALYGKSTQETRSGKNLFTKQGNATPKTDTTFWGGITNTTPESDGWCKVSVDNTNGTELAFANQMTKRNTIDKLEVNTMYSILIEVRNLTISGSSSTPPYLQLCETTQNSVWQSKQEYDLTVLPKTSKMVFQKLTKANFDNSIYDFRNYVSIPKGYKVEFEYRLMVVKGSYTLDTIGDYEPYGVMPSPDYPSEIKTITGNLKLTSCGKNLFSSSLFDKTGVYALYKLKDNTPYTLSLKLKDGKSIPSGLFIGFSSSQYSSTNPPSTVSIINNGVISSSASNKNGIYYYTRIANSTLKYVYFFPNNINIEEYFDVMLTESSSLLDYEPYQENTSLFTLNQPLRSLPNGTKDELVIENGRAKIIKRIGKVVLDGSETWYMDKELTNTVRFYTSEILTNKAKNAQPILSNYFITATSVNNINNDDNESAYVLNTTQLTIRINKSIANTLTTFKTWLSTHNVEVYYALETPIDIEITDPTLLAQLNALEQITQYKHTYITITGDDLTPEADFTYINNVVINNTDSVLGKDTYWNDEVPTQQDLPSKAQEGEIRIVQDTEDVYIYNGTKWVPFDKNSEVDLSNYLTKDNTTPWVPTGPFNPSTKKYVDDSVGGIHVPTKTSQLQNDSDFVIKTTNELTNYYTKNNTYTKNEVDALVAGGSGTSDYTTLSNKPSLDTTSDVSLNPLKEEINGEISLHKIAKTGNYEDLLYKPIIPITFTDNMESDYSISKLPGWQVDLLQKMIDEYVKDNKSINNYILKADGIMFLENYAIGNLNNKYSTKGKNTRLYTFKKCGPYGAIPHAFQFVGPTSLSYNTYPESGYGVIGISNEGILICCDNNYRVTEVCQRYKLYDEAEKNTNVSINVVPTNLSRATAFIATEDHQPATKKYVDDSIPTKTSQLTNDSNYTTLYSVENNYDDGTIICGWSSTATDGQDMTSDYGMTPAMAAGIQAGKKYEWTSRVSYSGTNNAVCYYASRDHGTADDGTSYNYVSAKIGNGTDWISFCWDSSTVYFGTTWPGSSGGKACFSGDTLVWTSEGDKKIKDMQIGDRVMSINIEKDIIEPREITKLVNHKEEEILVITTKDDTIKVTGSHPFYEKKKGKVNARTLEVGDELMDDKFGLHKITKIETKAFNDTVYEIVVDSTHNYFISKQHIRVFNEPSVLKD